MASYLPHHNAPRVWASEMQKPGAAKRNQVSPVSSGSSRSYASSYKGSAMTGRMGQLLQQTTSQTGNYLLYRDQVKFQQEHLQAQALKEEGEAVNQAAGSAIASMLGGPSQYSPGKQKSGGPNLPPPSTGGSPVGPASSPQARTPNPTGAPTAGPGQTGGWQMQAAVNASQSGLGLIAGPRQAGQPYLQQGNTFNVQQTRRGDARTARNRGAGGNIKGTLNNI